MNTTQYRVDATEFESAKAARAAAREFALAHVYAAFQFVHMRHRNDNEGWYAAVVCKVGPDAGKIVSWLKR